jgi:serine/threonine-protein kinase
VRRLLKRCLEKDPKKRLRDVAEGMLQLEESAVERDPVTPVVAGRRVPFWWVAVPLAVGIVLTAGVFAGVDWYRSSRPSPPRTPIRFTFEPDAAAPLFISPGAHDIAISPDGKTVVYVATESPRPPRLWLRRLEQLDAAPLRGGEGAVNPFVSPDNAWIGFLDIQNFAELKKVPITGGPPTLVARAKTSILGAAWMHDGSIVIGSINGLFTVPTGGGDPKPLTTLAAGETAHVSPSEVPGTSVVLFAAGLSGANAGVLAAVDRATGQVVRFDVPGSEAHAVPGGLIVYAAADASVRVLAFDAKTMRISGNPTPLIDGVVFKSSGAADLAVAADGRLAYVAGGTAVGARTLAWTDRSGKETGIAAPPRSYYYARISPDGTRLSLDIRDQDEDVWMWDLRRETLTRLTDTPGPDEYGLWTPDSQRVVFSSSIAGRRELFQKRADGTGRMEQITETSKETGTPYPNAVTADGKQVVFRLGASLNANDLFIAPLSGDRTYRKLLATDHDERNASLSPDGKWIAFESDLSGRYEVYVRPFPDVDGGQFPLSTAGGAKALWSPTGREIFYLGPDNKMMAVPVETAHGFSAGKPVAVFDASQYYVGAIGRNYDVAADGRRFVMIKNPAVRSAVRPITVVIDWADELRGRMKK